MSSCETGGAQIQSGISISCFKGISVKAFAAEAVLAVVANSNGYFFGMVRTSRDFDSDPRLNLECSPTVLALYLYDISRNQFPVGGTTKWAPHSSCFSLCQVSSIKFSIHSAELGFSEASAIGELTCLAEFAVRLQQAQNRQVFLTRLQFQSVIITLFVCRNIRFS